MTTSSNDLRWSPALSAGEAPSERRPRSSSRPGAGGGTGDIVMLRAAYRTWEQT